MSGYIVWLPIRMERNLRRSISFAGTPGLAGRSTVYTVSQLTYYYDDDPETQHPSGESRLKRWAKKLRFRKSRDGSEQCEVQGHVLRGEFVLREQPISDVMRERQHHGRLKFRPAPLSFPHLDEIEKDLEITRERNDRACSKEEHHYPNGIVPLYPDNVQSDPVSGRVKRRDAPCPPPLPAARPMTSEPGNGYVDSNHNRRQDGHIQKRTDEENVASVTDRLDRLQVKEPCFVGAFRKDSCATENGTSSTKRQAPSPPNQPVPPPRKKKEKRKRKHKTKITFLNVRGPDAGDEASDIEVVMNELQNLYSSSALSRNPSSSSSGFTSYMQWPSERRERFASDGSEPVPAEPPRDYSPERTTPSSEAHYSSVHTSTTSVPSGEEQPDASRTRCQTPSISISADYEEVTAVVPPPPPPLPGLNVGHELERKPSVPLASDLITQRSHLRKTHGPNRKSRSRTRTEHAPRALATDGSKVSEIRNALEEKGILEPYLHRASGRSSSFDDAYQKLNDYASGEGCRGCSPIDWRDASPTSPREVSPSSRFTYLPNGILTKPALKKVRNSNPSSGQRKAAQPTRRHTVSFQTTSVDKRNDCEDIDGSVARDGQASGRRDIEAWKGAATVVAPRQRQPSASSGHDLKHSVGQDLSHDDYNKLQATLRMHLEKPRELPKVNMRAVRQYEKQPDPPSELELFFKKRRQKMALECQEDSNQDHSLHSTSGDPESINLMSRLIETEAHAVGRDSS